MPGPKLTVKCPNCQKIISLDEVLTSQLEESVRSEYRQRMLDWQSAKEKALKEEIGAELEGKIAAQSKQEFEFLKEQLEASKKELEKARQIELEIRREKNAVEEQKKGLELEVQRRLDEERKRVEEAVARRMIEEHHLKEAEKEKIIADLKRALEEAQLKASQGSQQLQGEVLELELESLLKSEFPMDNILPVPKGMSGADLVEKVIDPAGRQCGVIIWESKRTKNWEEGWVQKLKDDQRATKADVAIIVSSTLPKEVKNFGPKDGIYVTNFENMLSVTRLIRIKLMELFSARQSSIGQGEKMQIIYDYLRGPEFRQKVEAIVEAFSMMQQDLDKEKMFYQKMWTKREKQIQRVIDSTLGMHGDLHGLMGASLPELPLIEVEAAATLAGVDSAQTLTQHAQPEETVSNQEELAA